MLGSALRHHRLISFVSPGRRHQGQCSLADFCVGDDEQGTCGQGFFFLTNGEGHTLALDFVQFISQTQEHHAGKTGLGGEDEIGEVQILGDDHVLMLARAVQDFYIGSGGLADG